MSRGKLRSIAEVCADCGASDPSWASINKGLLICDECCSVHRSLGRHISQVKSLKKGAWHATQLAMVHSLHSSGANSVWEHTLLDPNNAKSGRRKPGPKDPVHPQKADFIRAKHQNLAFVYRPSRDDGPILESDVNQQLHSSVRTANTETSLRFLAMGADPNYIHPEKGNAPLHVAAKSGQSAQIELLVVYGADPAVPDKDGKTPIEYARDAAYTDIADRLVECQYELTDRLAFYLCGRKPDHSAQHYVIPEMADSLDLSDFAVAAKKKLQALSNNLLEALAKDVYDEVDRRETDAIWLSTQNQSALLADRQTVPFLPVNPDYSSTRNQGRQKLARFNAREFATLIIDVLCEIKRRHLGLAIPLNTGDQSGKVQKKSVVMRKTTNGANENVSDDEPLYDTVASDEEYVDTESILPAEKKLQTTMEDAPTIEQQLAWPITFKEYADVKKQLSVSEQRIHQLQQNNKDMRHEITLLQNMVQRLMQENSYLRSFVQYGSSGHHSSMNLLPNGCEMVSSHSQLPLIESAVGLHHPSRSPRCSPRSSQRPQSMYEPRERINHPSPCSLNNCLGKNSCFGHPGALPRDDSGIGHTHSSHSSRDSGDYDNTSVNASQSRCSSRSPPSEVVPNFLLKHATNSTSPSQDEVFRKTEQITKKIQELLISAQENKHDCFIPCSEKVYRAVLEMASIFAHSSKEEHLRIALKQLTASAFRLQAECQSLLSVHQPTVDYCFVTQQVIQCAYDIAKAAKHLVTLFQ